MWNGGNSDPDVPAYLLDDYLTHILKDIDNFDEETGMIKGKPTPFVAKENLEDPGLEILKRQREREAESGGEDCLACMCCICC